MGCTTSIKNVKKSIEHHCAIVGVYDPDGDPVTASYALLFHMNNRGQEGSMIVTQSTTGLFRRKGGAGWVSYAYTNDDIVGLRDAKPVTAVGQNRYSTSGGLHVIQPFVTGKGGFTQNIIHKRAPSFEKELLSRPFALAHNGNLTNARVLLKKLPKSVQKLAKNDTGVAFLTLALAGGNTWEKRIREMVGSCEGAANFIISAEGKIFAYRDPWGFHPLSVGRLMPSEGIRQGYIVASENAGFRSNGISFVRDVRPGEGIVIDENGVHTLFMDERSNRVHTARCVFELVYFASPDSVIFGSSVSTVRRNIGKLLAQKDIRNGFIPDVIVPVQHSGIPFSEGYAKEMIYQVLNDPSLVGLRKSDTKAIAQRVAELQTQTGLVANIYANGRSFIAPGSRIEINTVKHRADMSVVRGKRVALIDDSLVRGSTAGVTMNLLRMAGAKEVHFCVGYPFVRNPCFMGIDFASPEELIVNRVGERNVAS